MKFQPFYEADKGTGGSAVITGDAASTPTEDAKTYTQAELDRLFAERAKQASSGEQKRILEALGVKDLAEGKSLMARLREQEQAQLTEAEKLRAKLAEYEKERETSQHAQRETNTRYEIKLEAQALGIVDPEDAYRLLDLSELDYDETGKPSNVEAKLRDLVAKKPYLLSKSGSGSSAANPASPPKNITIDPMIAAARKAAGLP